jgi:hypothetical protein
MNSRQGSEENLVKDESLVACHKLGTSCTFLLDSGLGSHFLFCSHNLSLLNFLHCANHLEFGRGCTGGVGENFFILPPGLSQNSEHLGNIMGKIINEPSYPVLDKAPGFWVTGIRDSFLNN